MLLLFSYVPVSCSDFYCSEHSWFTGEVLNQWSIHSTQLLFLYNLPHCINTTVDGLGGGGTMYIHTTSRCFGKTDPCLSAQITYICMCNQLNMQHVYGCNQGGLTVTTFIIFHSCNNSLMSAVNHFLKRPLQYTPSPRWLLGSSHTWSSHPWHSGWSGQWTPHDATAPLRDIYTISITHIPSYTLVWMFTSNTLL